MNIRDLQRLLMAANYYDGALDGDDGPKTWRGVKITEENDAAVASERWSDKRRLVAAGQRILNAMGYEAGHVDGYAGHNTNEALTAFLNDKAGISNELDRTQIQEPASGSIKWPVQRDMPKVFGPAGGPQCTEGVVDLPIKFVIAWNKRQKVSTFRCHAMVADAFTGFFLDAFTDLGAGRFQKMELHIFGGCYNYRKMRGGTNLSTHAYGAAIDLNPEKNQLRWRADRAQFAKPEYKAFFDIAEAYGLVPAGRAWGADWMHIQAARLR